MLTGHWNISQRGARGLEQHPDTLDSASQSVSDKFPRARVEGHWLGVRLGAHISNWSKLSHVKNQAVGLLSGVITFVKCDRDSL